MEKKNKNILVFECLYSISEIFIIKYFSYERKTRRNWVYL